MLNKPVLYFEFHTLKRRESFFQRKHLPNTSVHPTSFMNIPIFSCFWRKSLRNLFNAIWKQNKHFYADTNTVRDLDLCECQKLNRHTSNLNRNAVCFICISCDLCKWLLVITRYARWMDHFEMEQKSFQCLLCFEFYLIKLPTSVFIFNMWKRCFQVGNVNVAKWKNVWNIFCYVFHCILFHQFM